MPFEDGDKIEFDHVIALIRDGEDEERNISPAHKRCHKRKSKGDAYENAKTKRLEKLRLGTARQKPKAKWPAGKLTSRGFDKSRRKRMDGTVEVRE